MTSSVIPSRRYSSSLAPLRFSKYKTATDFPLGLETPESESVFSLVRRLLDSRSRFRRLRSVFNSVAVWHRKVRSFSRLLSRMPHKVRRQGRVQLRGGLGLAVQDS